MNDTSVNMTSERTTMEPHTKKENRSPLKLKGPRIIENSVSFQMITVSHSISILPKKGGGGGVLAYGRQTAQSQDG